MQLSLRNYIKYIKLIIVSFSTITIVLIGNYWLTQAIAIPPMEDIPEEILRTEIITVGRSPIDGKLLTAAEYAELQVKLQTSPPPKLNSQIRDQVFVLQLRKALLQIFPFLGI
ncbi:MAG: hypothetical protein EAZ76_01940 [Nostocales cyanobacterium]|nr:MAG: hypothetical protein EAZ87_13355 [Nostocales cyanobacterium]TAF20258.1 MAG: hypothetical protein EAZ76_01940 [Nostocales cyanobacterium]